MNKKNLKEKIKIAKELVSDVEEPYKTVVFGIVLTKLIDSDFDSNDKTEKDTKIIVRSSQTETGLQKGKEELTKACNISIKELDDVISVREDHIQVIAPLEGTEPEKQIIVAQCVLIAYEIMLNKEWISSSTLVKSIDKSGIGGLPHLGRNLKKSSNLFRSRGTRPNKEYKLFGPGRISACDIIRKLAKDEK